MAYNIHRYSNTLELNKVLNLLSLEAALADAAVLAQNLPILTEENEIKKALEQTFSAYRLLAKATSPSFGHAVNNKKALERAVVGAALNKKELLDIGETLRSIESLKGWRNNVDSNLHTEIDNLFDALIPNKYFKEKIFYSIKNEEELNDDASPELKNIRRKILSSSANIRERLEKIIRGKESSKYLQEALITQRDGRFVVPVKSEFRSEFSGIVHDTSSSGATLFIEPMVVVEINNDLRLLRAKERDEEERILKELSMEAASFAATILSSYEALVELSLIFAKANLAYKLKASVPTINTDGRIVLKNARHPLIDKEKVVPISLTLGDNFNTLVITGPNTGGKTVTLKTIGLLTLMTMCGLMIPCDDSSEIAVFDNILVDIGDEQSIEQSLSTFSSHMVNVIGIIENATPFSLVLLDELGAGTDPIEGAALAKSILIRLAQKGARIAATTHYAELKSYALDTEGVENASCEFDVQTLRPTYKLVLGMPGRSNAFAISERLGMDRAVIENAKSYISEENLRFENILASLEKERQAAEKSRVEADEIKKELVALREKTKRAAIDTQKEQDKIIEKARQNAQNIVDSARYKSDRLINELYDIKKAAEKENAAASYQNATRIAKRSIDELQDISNPINEVVLDYVLPRELVKGDLVKLIDLGKDGEVVEVKDGKVLVTSGNLKLWTREDNLMLLENKKKPKPQKSKVTGISSGLERTASLEIDMRGMASDEGIIELDRFINNAIMTGIGSITIIHGKGTGILRAAVHKFLRNHKFIKSFRLGTFGEGESGVTIAEIKRD